MAMVNIAVELARRGRRVLMVDFDLEAPGLDTLPLPQPPDPVPGVVDFVEAYLTRGATPDVRDFSYEVPGVGSGGGQLWVMPAGRADSDYADRLNNISWTELYERHDGYLMFEDLKAQWKQQFAPDYVLIDSRTGHTDEGGICTRHLPDAVFVFFIPNEQNLRGLLPMVSAMRAEASSPRQKEIILQFVMSNVPDLDDEESILERQLAQFRRHLGIDKNGLHTVYRYDSLLLLTQAIFTKDRPRSRLAAQYRQLTDSLCRLNPEDREGALQFLTSRDARFGRSMGAIEQRVKRIQAAHPYDPDVLFALARLRLGQGLAEDAAALLDDAIRAGLADADAYLQRAELYIKADQPQNAVTPIMTAMELPHIDPIQVSRALRLMSTAAPGRVSDLVRTSGVGSLTPEDRGSLATSLRRSNEELRAGTDMFRGALNAASPATARPLRSDLVFNLIGLGRFDEALREIAQQAPTVDQLGIQDVFNSGMARWALSGEVPKAEFSRVLQLADLGPDSDRNPNYLQCVALAAWAIGDADNGRTLLERARQAAAHFPSTPPTCWRYRTVSRQGFLSDLQAMEQFFAGGGSPPPVLHYNGRHVDD